LHVLIALVPGLARAGAYTVLTSQALAELLCKLPSLPDGRAGPALWRSAAVCAGEVAMALDTALPPPLLHACAYAVTRSLAFQEAQEADGEDDAFTVLEDGHALHAGVSALWRWCSHGSSGAAQLAALPTLFETVGSAYERSMQRDEDIVNWVKSKDFGGFSPKDNPAIRDKIAELWIEAQVCRLMTLRSMSIVQHGGNFTYEGSAEKVFAPEHGVRTTEAITQMLGPYAQLLNGSPHAVEQGVFAHNTMGAFQSGINHGSVQIMRDQVAKRGLGMPSTRSLNKAKA
jgi:hypothetical protein